MDQDLRGSLRRMWLKRIPKTGKLETWKKHRSVVSWSQWTNGSRVVIVQLLSCVQFFVTPRTAAHQASLFITNPRSLFKLMSIESVFHPVISCSVVPFSFRLQSFPASGSFPMSQFFTSGGQSIGASASGLPMNMRDWSPLGWTCWISLQSKGFSRVFSSTTVQKHQFFGAQLSSPSN